MIPDIRHHFYRIPDIRHFCLPDQDRDRISKKPISGAGYPVDRISGTTLISMENEYKNMGICNTEKIPKSAMLGER